MLNKAIKRPFLHSFGENKAILNLQKKLECLIFLMANLK